MQRIDTATRVVDKHGPGKDGFGDGNPATGSPSTQLNATAFDNYQEEIANAIELSGMTLNPADMTQLWQAIRAGGSGQFVRLIGDQMTGQLLLPSLHVFSQAPGFSPFTLFHNPTDGFAYSMWADTGALHLGDADGNGPVASWLQVNANGTAVLGNLFVSASPTTPAIIGSITCNGGRIIAQVPAPSYLPSISVYNPVAGAGLPVGAGGIWYNGGLHLGAVNGVGEPSADWFYQDTANNNDAVLVGNLANFQSVTFRGSAADGVSGTAAIYAVPGAGAFRFHGNPADAAGSNFYQLGVIAAVGELTFNSPTLPTGGGAWACSFNGTTTQAGVCNATGFNPPSDAILKTNVVDWRSGLDVVRRVNTVEFEYTEESGFGSPGTKYYGVTAQDLQAVLPEAVSVLKRYVGPVASLEQPMPQDYVPEYEEVLSVSHSTIFFACLNAIKEIAARLEALEGGTATPFAT